MSSKNEGPLSDDEQEFSLCSALQEVSQQGESQAAELNEKQQVLKSTQAVLSKMVKSYEAVASKIKLKERQINDIINETEFVQRHNETQEAQIQTILMENVKLKYIIKEQLERSQLLLAGYNTYREKMESYKTAVSALESQASIHKELIKKRKEIQKLKEHKKALSVDLQNPEGNAVRQAQTEKDNCKTQIDHIKELMRERSILLEKELEIHSQLRNDIAIHNRRCDAIVKRLRCQLNKAQSNHQELRNDIFHMEKEIQHLKKQLEILHTT